MLLIDLYLLLLHYNFHMQKSNSGSICEIERYIGYKKNYNKR